MNTYNYYYIINYFQRKAQQAWILKRWLKSLHAVLKTRNRNAFCQQCNFNIVVLRLEQCLNLGSLVSRECLLKILLTKSVV